MIPFRWRQAAALATLIVPLLLVPFAVQAGPGAERRKFEIQQVEVISNVPITIPDSGQGNPYPASIIVDGFKNAKIKDVNLTLIGLTHFYPVDLDVMLVSPGPDVRSAIVMSDVGSDINATDWTITFDDQAPGGLTDMTPIQDGGVYRPSNVGAADTFPLPAPGGSGDTLALFGGMSPRGGWNLFVVDDSPGDAGSIDAWKLTFTLKVPRGA